MTKKRKHRKKRIFLPKVQSHFCILSFVFILGCCIYYGSRLIKYYKIYNPKNEETGEVLVNLSTKIIDDNEIVTSGDGLYSISGNYVFKGVSVNNYILIDDILFRIIRINGDKTIDLVMDEYINRLEWNEEITTYDKSSIKKYVDTKVLPILNQDNLVKTTYCVDKVYELSEVSCESTNNDNYIRLLGINDYLNSLNDDKTYMTSGNEYIWLYNAGKNNAWHTTGTYLSNSKPNNIYGVKAVITLKNSLSYLKGNGTEYNPYIIEKNDLKVKVGSYLDINDDIYIVYEIGKDYIKAESNKLLKTKQIFDKTSTDYSESSLKKYLEDTYLNSLGYKDFLINVNFSDVKSKIGLLSLSDFKFNSTLNNYFLDDSDSKLVSVYNGSILKSEPSAKRNIRFGIGLKNNLSIISGNGSKYAPFIVEVK